MRKQAAVQSKVPPVEAGPDVVSRSDGYYWIDEHKREIGPFPSVAAALADMAENAEGEFEPGAELREAEADIGVAEWIDPDTGEPAEEERTRTEDH